MNFKDQHDFLKSLVKQVKIFGRGIISLCEMIANLQQERKKLQKEKIIPLNENNIREQLEKKVEYLNTIISEYKQNIDERDLEFKQLFLKYQTLEIQLKSQREEKEKADQDLQELINEFSIFKERSEIKFNELVVKKESQIADLKRKLDFLDHSSNPKITEKDEEVEDLKEKIEEKEKVIREMMNRVGTTINVGELHFGVAARTKLINCLNSFGNQVWSISSIIIKVCAQLAVNEVEYEDFNFKPLRSDENDPELILELLEKRFSRYLNKDQSYLQLVLDRMMERRKNESRPDDIPPRTPLKNSLIKESLLIVKNEVQEQLQNTIDTIEKSTAEQLYSKLKIEIERGQILENKVDDLNKILHKISFIIYEEIDRLAWVHRSATDLSSLEDFRGQVMLCKGRLMELLERHNLSGLHISQEYENQRHLWEQKINYIDNLLRQELLKLRDQLTTEKIIHEKNCSKLVLEKERLKEDSQHTEKIYKDEIEKHIKKNFDIESDLLELRQRAHDAEQKINTQERMLAEKAENIHFLQNTNSNLQKKLLAIENDQIAAIQKLKLSLNENELETKQHEAEIKILTQRNGELEVALEEEKRQFKDANESLAREFQNYKEQSERGYRDLREGYQKVIDDQLIKLHDLTTELDQLRKNYSRSLKLKEDEVHQLSLSQKATEELYITQLETVKHKEEKIIELTEELRYKIELSKELRRLHNKVIEFDALLLEVDGLKNKNKKYIELLTTHNQELSQKKIEIQSTLQEKNEIITKANKIEREYNFMREQLKKFQDKYEEAFETIEQYRNEVKILKKELDIAHEKLILKEQENRQPIKDSFQINSRHEETSSLNSQVQISYKDEIISKLKADLRHLATDNEMLKKEYQRIIERNEDIITENRRLRNVVKENTISVTTPEKFANIKSLDLKTKANDITKSDVKNLLN